MLQGVTRLVQIPEYWRTKICICGQDLFGLMYGPYPPIKDIPHPKSGYAVCSVCGKLRWEHLWECTDCSEVFLRDFAHPGFDWKAPKCWECLEQNPDFVCTNYPQSVVEIHINKGKRKGSAKKESELLKLAQRPSVFSFRGK